MTHPDFSPEDHRWMARAIHLAERGLYTTDPNPRVGCVIVHGGEVVGEGWHRRAGGPHAEIEALNAARERARGATAYVSLEPCCHHGRTPPCTEALIGAGIARVIAAMEDPNPKVAGAGIRQLSDAGVTASAGLLLNDAEALNPGFCKRMRTGRPLLRSKLAMSLDGRTAMASGESQWITSADARRDVHRLRARSSAVLTGVGTVLADDPELTARLGPDAGEIVQPVRVVLDSRLRVPASARIAATPGRTIILTQGGDATPSETASEAGKSLGRLGNAAVHALPSDSAGKVDLDAVAEWLGRAELNEVLVEAGATLNGALLRAGLVDEWIVYMAPVILGDGGRGLFHLPELQRMADRFELKMTDVRPVGADLRLTFRANR